MSARRRQRGEGLDVLGSSGVLSPQDTDASIYSAMFDKVDSGRQRVQTVSIFDVLPDPHQPRRAIPSPVRAQWDGKPATTPALFMAWHRLAMQERGQEFQIEPYLLADDTAVRVAEDQVMGPIDTALVELLDLAANIRSNGLTNPITVVHSPNGYHLETGERRWLAYHLLYAYFETEQDKWGRIAARVVEQFSVWRQASENGARANLNAIGRARQLALLIMDLYERRGEGFEQFEQMVNPDGTDRAYYAQVADGVRYPIIRGYNDLVMAAVGLKVPSQVREHRDLLRLPDEVWRIADDLGWTQGKIRSLERQSKVKGKVDTNLLISLALKEAEAEGYRIGIGISPPPTLPDLDSIPTTSPLFAAENFDKIRRLARIARKVGEGAKLSTRDELELPMLREWVYSWLQEVDQNYKRRSRP